jgi:hypothetical protein
MHYVYYPLDYKPEDGNPSHYYFQYAVVYKDAIHVLLKEYLKSPPWHDYSLAPIHFLLRQYIELQLKGIIICAEQSHETIIGHDIIKLYEKARKTVEQEYGLEELRKPNEDVVRFIQSLGEFDRKAQAFRYPEGKDGKDFFDESVKMDAWLRERIISLPKLNEIAEKIIGDLEDIGGYVQHKRENEEESLANADRS